MQQTVAEPIHDLAKARERCSHCSSSSRTQFTGSVSTKNQFFAPELPNPLLLAAATCALDLNLVFPVGLSGRRSAAL